MHWVARGGFRPPCRAAPRTIDSRPRSRAGRPAMRILHFFTAAAVAVVAGCGADAIGNSNRTRPSLAHDPDLTGLPDITVDAAKLATSWVIYDETFEPTACDVIESP